MGSIPVVPTHTTCSKAPQGSATLGRQCQPSKTSSCHTRVNYTYDAVMTRVLPRVTQMYVHFTEHMRNTVHRGVAGVRCQTCDLVRVTHVMPRDMTRVIHTVYDVWGIPSERLGDWSRFGHMRMVNVSCRV